MLLYHTIYGIVKIYILICGREFTRVEYPARALIIKTMTTNFR